MEQRIPDAPAPRRTEGTSDESWEGILQDHQNGVIPPWRDANGVIYTDKIPSWARDVALPTPAGTREEPVKTRFEQPILEGQLRLEPGTELYDSFERMVPPWYDFFDNDEPEPDDSPLPRRNPWQTEDGLPDEEEEED